MSDASCHCLPVAILPRRAAPRNSQLTHHGFLANDRRALGFDEGRLASNAGAQRGPERNEARPTGTRGWATMGKNYRRRIQM